MSMKYLDDFRNSQLAQNLVTAICSEINPNRSYNFMEFCGGHTHAIFKSGIHGLIKDKVNMIHGPGCPVCVLPQAKIDAALHLLENHRDIILCVYGDLLRAPGSRGQTLLKAKARSHDVRMVYSTMDAIALARENSTKQVVFFAIGFETTTPATAIALLTAQAEGLSNFSVFCNHVLTPPAIRYILEAPELRDIERPSIDGFIGPAHVSTVVGSQVYEYFAREFQKPVVIAGFEPLDILSAILSLVRQKNRGEYNVENEYSRAVSKQGNQKAQEVIARVFELRPSFEWRGLGFVPYSALRIKTAFAQFDAERRFEIPDLRSKEPKACQCGAILRGVKTPTDCRLFGKTCTPDTPIGPCMVSSEGACAALFMYGSEMLDRH